jgi:adenylate kinase family enzyme
MSYFIIIRGPLGVGKTTIAKELTERLNAYYVSIDKILHDNKLDKIKGEGISLKNFIKANELAIPKIKDNLSRGKSVVIDGCFYRKEQIEHFIDNLPPPHYVFTLKASVEVCIERDKGRDRVYGEGAAVAVHSLVSKFDYGEIIDTDKKSSDEVTNEILSITK